MKRMLLVEIFLLVTVMLAGPSRAAVFSCDDVGLDAAIAASKAGDAGPHSLNCSPGDIIRLDRGLRDPSQQLTADLTLDGRGVTIECALVRTFLCDPVFRIASTVFCGPPTCDPPVFGPPPTVELRDLTLLGGASKSAEMPRSHSGTPW